MNYTEQEKYLKKLRTINTKLLIQALLNNHTSVIESKSSYSTDRRTIMVELCAEELARRIDGKNAQEKIYEME